MTKWAKKREKKNVEKSEQKECRRRRIGGERCERVEKGNQNQTMGTSLKTEGYIDNEQYIFTSFWPNKFDALYRKSPYIFV